MGRHKKKLDESEIYQRCCLCIKKTTRNQHYITEYYVRKKKFEKYDEEVMTIYDILENLGLLSYEIGNIQDSIICGHCKKIIFEFFDFKVITENAQKENNLPSRYNENFAQVDSIKKYLRPQHFDTLKRYIVSNIVESVEETETNELNLRPAKANIKTELFVGEAFSDMSFIDPNLIKIEKEEKSNDDDVDLNFCDDEMSNTSEPIESTSVPKMEDSDDDNLPEEEINEFIEPENEDRCITKTVVDNVQFISRIPECVADFERAQQINDSSTRKPPDPSKWQRIIQREARAKGEAYVSKQGKAVRAREMKPPCENCRYECSKRVSESDRRKNFQNHWGLADFALQKKFLFEHTKIEPVARRRKRQENGYARSYSSKYYLDTFNDDGTLKGQEKVCESMFCATFDVCKNNLRYLYKKIRTGKVQDLRGTNRRKPSEGHQIAIDFVKQFPFFHIDKQMTVRKIYQDYSKICEEKGVDIVSENTFRGIFSTYNESEFLKEDRRKIKCEICAEYIHASDERKVALQYNFDVHISQNFQCRSRFRWRRNRLARKERLRLEREQKQATDVNPAATQNNATEISYY